MELVATGLKPILKDLSARWKHERVVRAWKVRRPLAGILGWFSFLPKMFHEAYLVLLENGEYHILERGKFDPAHEVQTLVKVAFKGLTAWINDHPWSVDPGAQQPLLDGPLLYQVADYQKEYMQKWGYHFKGENCQELVCELARWVAAYTVGNKVRRERRRKSMLILAMMGVFVWGAWRVIKRLREMRRLRGRSDINVDVEERRSEDCDHEPVEVGENLV